MPSSTNVHRLSFYTSYRQFYLVDADAEYDTADRGFWTTEASDRGLAVGDGMLGIGTASYGHIRCFFEFVRSEPTLPLSPWERVVEASIRLTEGRYAVIPCPDSDPAHEGTCPPGDYRLRIYGAFLDQLVKDTAGDDYFDFYWLVLWPAPFSKPKVLKKPPTRKASQKIV
jgi:hypothetical protein